MVKKDLVHLKAASIYSKLSKCQRKQVGCVAVRDDRIVATGINGTITGQPNKCEDAEGNTLPTVVHSEMNLICFCAREGISLKDTILYLTLSPCIVCAKLIVVAGIKKVFYSEEYRDNSGIKYLNSINFKIEKEI